MELVENNLLLSRCVVVHYITRCNQPNEHNPHENSYDKQSYFPYTQVMKILSGIWCFKIMRLLILNAVPLCYGQIDYKIGINVVQDTTVYTTPNVTVQNFVVIVL